jgi:hypothetical protein
MFQTWPSMVMLALNGVSAGSNSATFGLIPDVSPQHLGPVGHGHRGAVGPSLGVLSVGELAAAITLGALRRDPGDLPADPPGRRPRQTVDPQGDGDNANHHGADRGDLDHEVEGGQQPGQRRGSGRRRGRWGRRMPVVAKAGHALNLCRQAGADND